MVEVYLWISLTSSPALLVGLLVRRWWAVPLTLTVYVLFCLIFPHVYSESYSNSSDFDSAADYSVLMLIVWAVPAAMAAILGVVVRGVVRWIVLDRTMPTGLLNWPLRWLEVERQIAKDTALRRTTRPTTGSARRSGRGR